MSIIVNKRNKVRAFALVQKKNMLKVINIKACCNAYMPNTELFKIGNPLLYLGR